MDNGSPSLPAIQLPSAPSSPRAAATKPLRWGCRSRRPAPESQESAASRLLQQVQNSDLLFLLVRRNWPSGITNQTQLPPDRCQTFIGIVDPQMQPELRPRGEHPVRLVRALSDQIVDQDPDIALSPAKIDWRTSPSPRSRIQSRDQPLAAGFLVTRRPVDLARQKQALESTSLPANASVPAGRSRHTRSRTLAGSSPRPPDPGSTPPSPSAHRSACWWTCRSRRFRGYPALPAPERSDAAVLSGNLTILSSIEGQYRGPTPSIWPLYSGDRAMLSLRIRCVSSVV